MGFPKFIDTEAQERARRRAQWITESGEHVVEIACWRYDPPGTRKFVIFELQNDAGQKLHVRFRLRVGDLRLGELLRFACVVMGWEFEAQRHQTFTIKSATNFNQLVGRRLTVNVAQDEKGFHRIVGGRPYRYTSDA